MKKLIALSIFALLLNACAGDNNTSKESGNKKEIVAESKSVQEKYKIMFFINPNGRPCQMQDQILSEMGEELTSRADVQYVKTTELATARPLFIKYGIRALPSMVVLDSEGKVSHRFTPGIQPAERILSKIGG